jgi:hypothetical protein
MVDFEMVCISNMVIIDTGSLLPCRAIPSIDQVDAHVFWWWARNGKVEVTAHTVLLLGSGIAHIDDPCVVLHVVHHIAVENLQHIKRAAHTVGKTALPRPPTRHQRKWRIPNRGCS